MEVCCCLFFGFFLNIFSVSGFESCSLKVLSGGGDCFVQQKRVCSPAVVLTQKHSGYMKYNEFIEFP